ncbi:MAG: aldehyde dehydrogenase family protein [Alphaproteobacteria bacterium]|nr:MAG: aldehyde dehydrogenase family protein [Alphaproteobacteria bacterium]
MSRRILNVRNPRTGEHDYRIHCATPDDIRTVVQPMREAQKAWLDQGFEHRAAILAAFRDRLSHHRESLIGALAKDTGRLRISEIEVDGVIRSIDRWIGTARSLAAEETGTSRSMPGIHYRIVHDPYPLVGTISPWNFPLTLSMIDTIPALLAGSAVCLKPSEITPRFAEPLRTAIEETEELSTVLSIINGDGETGAALVAQVDTICFTGSVRTGLKVAQSAAAQLIPAFLELGGNDPALVLDDADVERAATAILRASVVNTGQACQSIERIYVARPILDDFLARIVAKAEAVELNYPDIESGHIGPIISLDQARIIESQLSDARAKGATFHCGGEIEMHGGGAWCRPTVMTGVNDEMRIMTDETFGPVMPIVPFDTDEEAVSLANNTDYGLSAAVFSSNPARAEAIARKLEAGAISINDASLTSLVHDVEKNSYKLSGLGASRMGDSGYLRFFRKKALIINDGEPIPIDAMREDM